MDAEEATATASSATTTATSAAAAVSAAAVATISTTDAASYAAAATGNVSWWTSTGNAGTDGKEEAIAKCQEEAFAQDPRWFADIHNAQCGCDNGVLLRELREIK